MGTDIILHTTSKSELKELIADAIKEHFPQFLKQNEKPDTRLYTRKEVAELLSITLPTLHAWTKDGLIKSVRIGQSVRYRPIDVEKALEDVRSIKYSRYNKERRDAQ